MGVCRASRALAVVAITLIGVNVEILGCQITEKSGPEPYLVRIIDCASVDPRWPLTPNDSNQCLKNITVAHGSLIAPDKVLSTCAWYKGATELGQVFRIYNNEQRCSQERTAYTMLLHRDCQTTQDKDVFQRNDFGLWITDKPFDITMNALLWRGQWGGLKPPSVADMKAAIRKVTREKSSCKAGVFANVSAVDSQRHDGKIQTIPWSRECLKNLEKIFLVNGNYAERVFTKFGSSTFLCSVDDLPSESLPVGDIINIDWYSGAAVVCEVNGKKIPIGMFSRVMNPPPWANPQKFRISVTFHPRRFYRFLRDNVGIEPNPGPHPPTEDCQLSGNSLYPYLLRITKTSSGFDPVITVGHGAVIRKNMVLSTCSPYKDVPKDLSKDTTWTFWGYNKKKHCVQRRRPRTIYKHEDCTKSDPGRIMANDFAIWKPLTEFKLNEYDPNFVYPNLWAGPCAPPYTEVARSIIELSDDKYVGIVSRRLSVGVFAEPNLFSVARQWNTDMEFVSWAECETQLELFDQRIGLKPVVMPDDVVGKKVFPVFCTYDKLRPTGPGSNVSQVDWYSGAILMYSFLYVFDWGDPPVVRTYPLGMISRVYRGKSKQDEGNLRVVSAFGKNFYEFVKNIDNDMITPLSGQTPCHPTGFAVMSLVVPIITKLLV